MTISVKITTEGDTALASVPYNTEFNRLARKAGGSFDRSKTAWEFDARDEELLKAICWDIYRDDGRPQPLISVEVELIGDDLRKGQGLGP